MEIPYHYGRTYAMSLRVFSWRAKRGGRLTETTILKSKGKERSASPFCTSFFRYLEKEALASLQSKGREACGRKRSSLPWIELRGGLWETFLHNWAEAASSASGWLGSERHCNQSSRRLRCCEPFIVTTRKLKGELAISVLNLRKIKKWNFLMTNPWRYLQGVWAGN